MKLLTAGILLFLLACAGKDQASPSTSSGAGRGLEDPGYGSAQRGSESRVGSDSLGDPPDGPRQVTASPTAPHEIALRQGDVVADMTVSVLGPRVYAVMRGEDARTRVLMWSIGRTELDTLATLPDSVRGVAIVEHPARGWLFVAADSGGGSRIYRFTRDDDRWTGIELYSTRRVIERLVMSTRPFAGEEGVRYRLYFAARSADGSLSVRTITEGGRAEYQAIGPERTADSSEFEFGPNRLVATGGTPLQFHPNGSALYWRDTRGCTHRRVYDHDNWGDDAALEEIPCDGELRLAPNGRTYFHWRSGRAGVAVLRVGDHSNTGSLAAGTTFLTAPVALPDGRGLAGVVTQGGGVAIAYVPVAMPLADVANAWALGGTLCDETMFLRNGGLFRDFEVRDYPQSNQLFAVYERSHYEGVGETPALATTDLFLENFGIAFNGVFIVLERRRAIPAFREFVDAANAALARSDPGSTWAKAFGAVSAFYRGERTGEAGLIANGRGELRSNAIDSIFNFDELMPRGHYTSDSAMQDYFRAVHYLTQINQVRDPEVLASLPAEVQRKAMRWIDGYRPFIAPSRADLVWTVGEGRAKAPYARHPWRWHAVFPLSWGIDNEALEAAVQHDDWPVEEWIVGPGPVARQHPSGLDVAMMFGNRLARTLHADTLMRYAQLGPILDGIGARRPAPSREASIYQRWLDVVALDWADSTEFPGAPVGSQLWATKRLQSGLASWATIREATILVSERAGAAEMGEGGFEYLDPEPTRGYVEPAPQTFEGIADLYDALRGEVEGMEDLQVTPGEDSRWSDASLRDGIAARLRESAVEARRYADMARRQLRGEMLTEDEYRAIQRVGGSAEHMLQVYKSLSTPDLGLSVPDPMPKIADVQGDLTNGVLEVAVGAPIEWHQLVPFFGRRQIAVGSVYSYYEFVSRELYDNERWRREVPERPHPTWVQPYMASTAQTCRAPARR